MPARSSMPTASKALVAVICLLFLTPIARADFSLGVIGQTELIDFQSYTGAGLQPGGGAGTLDSNNWGLYGSGSASLAGETISTGGFARGTSTGGVSAPGFYAFQTGGGNVALGAQPDDSGGSFPQAGAFLRVTNNTGFTVDYIRVEYELWFLNDSDGITDHELQFYNADGLYDPNFFESPEAIAIAPVWQKTDIEFDLVLPVAGFGGTIDELEVGDNLNIEWTFTGSGAPSALNGYDEVAFDNIRITAFSSQVPEPSTLLLAFASSAALLISRSKMG